MKKILYSTIGALMFSLIGCDTLDLAPEDYSGAGNYWKNEGQVATFMNGLHVHLRGDYTSQMVLGELRGGTMRNGTSSVGTSLDYASLIINDLRTTNTGVSNWNGYYSRILQVNHFIEEVENACTFLSESERNTYLGQAYGLRAYYYFMLYRTYGGVPLEKEIKVADGSIDAPSLYLERSSAEDILNFIKDDIKKSEEGFGTTEEFNKYYWSKYATLFLKAQVYMWSAKVTTNDDTKAHTATGESDLLIAEKALNDIIGSNKFELLPDYADIFDVSKKDSNKESILSLYFERTEATNWGSQFVSNPSLVVGVMYDTNGDMIMEDVLELGSQGLLRYEWKESFVKSFDANDKRRSTMFREFYSSKDIEDGTLSGFGSEMLKYIGHTDEGLRYFDSDVIMMRYAEVLLMMAEVANGLGKPCASYINDVRERACGTGNYVEYVDGSYAENELAILKERDKEFFAEGKRWFDVVRMHDAEKKPLVFSADAAYPNELSGQKAPILNADTEQHKLLWPINIDLITADPLLKQTWGYKKAEGLE
ncbi:RagB/SusD family nutrient uptake outer membrane protein [Bacteroides caecigallinarum]|uniref:RagB/SusD family nutrient uptake outer membrane protein n=1 Tax=Bacteroides caecigallinarum TaxID=1411144 RepID=UPI001F1908CB|nr:RagB/SusD family nutrient uptake outer membrane protein [Bacteroides caecigallinarum]MCF2580937.1 RagB/SusD family nutrient uptake outer membrane protein [Bacteroides caecigallinarum]